jgi:hypothetical protein
MEDDERVRLAEVMAAIGGGDTAAVFTLVEEFGGRLRAAARRAGERMGVRLTADDLDELVMEVALALAEVAGSWRPDGGALPWVWAEKRVTNAVSRHIGQHHDDLDEAVLDRRALDDGPAGVLAYDRGVREVLDGAVGAPLCALRLLGEQIGWDKAEILFEYRCQQDAGDPSPAETLAALHGIAPATVRQIVHRATKLTRRLVAEDPALAALATSRLVA